MMDLLYFRSEEEILSHFKSLPSDIQLATLNSNVLNSEFQVESDFCTQYEAKQLASSMSERDYSQFSATYEIAINRKNKMQEIYKGSLH